MESFACRKQKGYQLIDQWDQSQHPTFSTERDLWTCQAQNIPARARCIQRKGKKTTHSRWCCCTWFDKVRQPKIYCLERRILFWRFEKKVLKKKMEDSSFCELCHQWTWHCVHLITNIFFCSHPHYSCACSKWCACTYLWFHVTVDNTIEMTSSSDIEHLSDNPSCILLTISTFLPVVCAPPQWSGWWPNWVLDKQQTNAIGSRLLQDTTRLIPKWAWTKPIQILLWSPTTHFTPSKSIYHLSLPPELHNFFSETDSSIALKP